MFIKKLFEDKVDGTVHKQFVRFGKGKYDMRAIMNVTQQENRVKISSSFELANDLVEFVSNLANKFSVSGVILSKDRIDGFDFRKKAGILACNIEREMTASELKDLAAKAYATLIDCSAPGISLKIKKNLPKPGKSGETKINDKFCVLEIDKKFWPQAHIEFFFDLPLEFKKARIEHSYIITDIIMPQGETDFEKIRIMAKRKGKISRKIIVDGKEIIREKNFVA